MTKNLLLLPISILTFSFGEPQKEEEKEVLSTTTRAITIFYENDEITSDSYLGKVAPNEELKISISASDKYPVFKTSTKTVKFHWKKKVCLPSPVRHCLYIDKQGQCNINYRELDYYDYNPVDMSQINFNNQLRYKIDDSFYSIGDFVKSSKNNIFYKRSFSSSDLNESNALTLNYNFKIPSKKYRTGFLSYGSCQGLNKKGFRVDANTSVLNKAFSIPRIYNVQIELREVK